MDSLGSHIRINGTIFNTLVNYYNRSVTEPKYHIPVQIFAGNPQAFYRKKIDSAEIKKTKEYIETNNLNIYIHGPYVLNIGRETSTIQPALNCLIYELNLAHDISSKGVVIHVGKYLCRDASRAKQSVEESLKNSYDNIMYLINNSRGRLLLETPAGQGTELLTKIEDFIKFVKSIGTLDESRTSREFIRARFGIVVDTCHVFACGYDPLDYLKQIVNTGLTIDLVHLNDSKDVKGSCKDRHECIGEGYIGLEKLTECVEFCKEHKINYLNE